MRTVKEVTAVAVAMGCGPQRSLPAAVSPIASGASGPAGSADRHVPPSSLQFRMPLDILSSVTGLITLLLAAVLHCAVSQQSAGMTATVCTGLPGASANHR